MRKQLLAIFLLANCFLLYGCDTPPDSDGESEITNEIYRVQNDDVNDLEEIDHTLSDVLVECGYTIDHASQIQGILNTVGINDIEVESMTGEAENGLNAVVCFPNGEVANNKRFYFTTENGVLFYAGFSEEDLYDSAQGGFLKNYDDVPVPEKTVSVEVYEELRTLSEDEVKSCLNYPDTADFGMLDWGIGRSDEHYQVIGSVTAKNGAGMKVSVPFSVWFEYTESGFIVEGISLDGVMVK